ncbi:MAG: alpha/beta hydrolase [Acidobacteriota bacterium]
MKAWTAAAVAVGGGLILAGVAGAFFMFKRPLTVLEWSSRRALARAGLAASTVDSPAGPQVVWRGGEGPTLVLLHGAGDQAGTWARVARELTGQYTLVIPDLAGHGRSAPRTGPIDTGQVLAGVEAVVEREAGTGPVVLVGNSLGGWMALLVAHRHPEWVERVVVVSGGAIRGQNTEVKVIPTTREEARATVAATRDPGSPPVPDFVLDDIVRQARSGPLGRFAATAATMGRHLLDDRLHEVTVPVELLWGESDRLMPLDYARRLAAELPRARLTTIPRCGHVPQVECPQAFLAALRGVLGEPAP